MKKFVCSVCGYVHEGDSAPEMCPICKVKAEKFKEQSEEKVWAAEHVVGVAKGVDERIIEMGFTFASWISEKKYEIPSVPFNVDCNSCRYKTSCRGLYSVSGKDKISGDER